jgi:hypothetical protein
MVLCLNKPYYVVVKINILYYVLLVVVEVVKIKKTIVLDQELVDWIEEQIRNKEFGSISHAIEKALFELKKTY